MIKKKLVKNNTEKILDIPEPNENIYSLISYVKEVDFKNEFDDIKEWLELRPSTPAQMEDILYDSASYANRCQVLIEHVKLERKKYELECNDRLEILRSNAIEYLEEEKKSKDLKKQITNQMIEDRILVLHSKLYIDIKQKQNEMKSVESLVINLADQIKNREINIRKIIDIGKNQRFSSTTRPAWANKRKD